MNMYLYRFAFEFPAQRVANKKYGWDDEDSYCFFIEAETPEQALEWGRDVSEEFVSYMYRETDWKGPVPSWKEDDFGHRIDDDPGFVAAARQWGAPSSVVGEMPDFTTWPDVL